MATIRIEFAHDPDAGVWFIARSDIPGLAAEAPTAWDLAARLPHLLQDLGHGDLRLSALELSDESGIPS